jgi:hypothetical protein
VYSIFVKAISQTDYKSITNWETFPYTTYKAAVFPYADCSSASFFAVYSWNA